jgi:hypothetical protein
VVVLERAVEFHEHVEQCTVCTAGARDDIFCMAGFRLLLMAMNEAMEVVERSIRGRDNERAREAADSASQKSDTERPGEPREKRDRKHPLSPRLARAAGRLNGAVPQPVSTAPPTEASEERPA